MKLTKKQGLAITGLAIAACGFYFYLSSEVLTMNWLETESGYLDQISERINIFHSERGRYPASLSELASDSIFAQDDRLKGFVDGSRETYYRFAPLSNGFQVVAERKLNWFTGKVRLEKRTTNAIRSNRP